MTSGRGSGPASGECYEEGLVCMDDRDGTYHFDLNYWNALGRPTSKAPPQRYYKTEIRVTVLHDAEWAPTEGGLGDVAYQIDEGPFVGTMEHLGTQELLPKQMADALSKHGSEPGFFGLTDGGHHVDDIDEAAQGIDEHDLDEVVHDLKSKEASEVNNGGVFSQVEFLLDQGFRLLQIKELSSLKEES